MFRRLAVPLVVLLIGGGLFCWAWLRNAADESPPTPDEQFVAGMQAVDRLDFDRAQTAIDALDASDGYGDQARIVRAAMAVKLGHPADAIRELTTLPVAEELRAVAALVLAHAFFAARDLTNAEHAANAVVSRDPNNPAGHRLLAAIYYDLGANAAAIGELRVVMALDPDDFRPHHLLGQIDFDIEKYREAVAELQAALKRSPQRKRRFDVTLLLARAYLKSRQFADASRLLDGVSAGNASLLALHSEARWAEGELDQARRLLREAASIEPENRFVLLQQARLAIADGKPRLALPPLKKRLAADPHDMEARYQLALCYQKLGDTKRYEAESSRLKETQRIRKDLSELSDEAIRQPRNADVRERIAVLYEKLGRPKLAKVYRQAAEACRRFAAKTSFPAGPPDQQ